MAVVIGAVGIQEVRHGSFGIREMFVGDARVYGREGGAFFLKLDTSENGPGAKDNNQDEESKD